MIRSMSLIVSMFVAVVEGGDHDEYVAVMVVVVVIIGGDAVVVVVDGVGLPLLVLTLFDCACAHTMLSFMCVIVTMSCVVVICSVLYGV